MLANQMTPQRKLQRVKINLLRNPKVALLSGILMVGKTYTDASTPTARTNGRDEWYGEKFIKELKEKELAFVIMHEASHKMYRHLSTWKRLHDESHQLANAACDYVVNLMLKDLDPTETFMAMPKAPDGTVMGLIDERFRGMNAKQVFDILKQERRRGGGGGDGGESGFDEHDWGGAELSKEEREALERELDQAIRQGIIANRKVNGAGGGDLERSMGDLVAPKVDWREQLREFVKAICMGKDNSSWRKPNRRFIGSDIYLPTMISEKMHHIVCGVDTSGSISSELGVFMSEMAAVFEQVNPERVDLIYWDGRVAGHEKYEGSDAATIVGSTKPVGGGGTSPSCVTAYMKEHGIKPDCVVMFTDGYVGSDWGGEWPCPVLWCIVGNDSAVASVGKTIHINE